MTEMLLLLKYTRKYICLLYDLMGVLLHFCWRNYCNCFCVVSCSRSILFMFGMQFTFHCTYALLYFDL